MSPKTKLRTTSALALAAVLTLTTPAAAAGRSAAPGPLSQVRSWILELLPQWFTETWIGEHGHGIDPNGGAATDGEQSQGSNRAITPGAENKHGHTIDPDG